MDQQENSKKEKNLYNLAQEQLNMAITECQLNENVKIILQQPKNELIINFPVEMDNGNIKLFKSYRVQHNNILGPYKGGLRFSNHVHLDEVKSLAMWMTLKNSLQQLPYGGAKGGIKMNPHDYSKKELERISRNFCKYLCNFIGPDIDIPAPDMGTNSQTMDWMTSAYENLGHQHTNSVFTGKSIECGGSEGRSEATGFGVVSCIKKWAEYNNFDLKGKTYIIQGFGNVGSNTAILLSHLGLTCLAVGDHTGYLKNNEGFNVYKLNEFVQKNKSLENYHGEKISKEDFFSLECDIVIPAALELVICGDEAQNLNCKVVVEAANGPLDIEADKILAERNINVIPDILANSGGVVVSYYEWLQNKRCESWKKDDVLKRLDDRMTATYNRVCSYSKKQKISMRIASYVLALKNIESIYLKKGFDN